MSAASHNYDRGTGQTFKEWTEHPLKLDDIEWQRKGGSLEDKGSSGLGVKGPRSFVDIVVKVVAENLSFVEIDDLDNVPWTVVGRVWEYLEKSNFSLQAWKVLVNRLLKENKRGILKGEDPNSQPRPIRLYKTHYEVPVPTGPLRMYTNPLISPSFDFIVHLTLAGHLPSFDTSQLLALSKLKNLGVLEMIQPAESTTEKADFPRITDAVIRQWAEEPDPFPALRVMKIWGDHFTTAQSLQYISRFPSLAVYDVAGLSRDWPKQMLDCGWRYRRHLWCQTPLFEELFTCMNLFYAHPSDYPANWSVDNKNPEDIFCCWWVLYHNTRPQSKSTESDAVTIIGREESKKSKKSKKLNEFPQHIASLSLGFHSDGEKYKFADFEKYARPEFWGYLLYCHIGQIWEDQDLVALGISEAKHAFVFNDLQVIPPRPFVHVALGDMGKRTNTFDTSYFFARPETEAMGSHPNPATNQSEPSGSAKRSSSPAPLPRRMRKKQKGYSMEEFM